MKNILAFIFGGIFSLGLMISGMSNPQKVLNFLDVFGEWDSSLAFVMMGAILVAFIPFQMAVRNAHPQTLLGEAIELPTSTQIDTRLILGAILFGIGWGLVGICPAPSLTLIGLGYYQSLYFVLAMFSGISLHQKWSKKANG